MSKRGRPKQKGPDVLQARASRPAIPSLGKPQRYHLFVELTMGTARESLTLVEGGPLAMCEEHGMRAANYGVFHLREDWTREWHRPTRVVIERVEEHSERSEGDGSHSEADS